MKCPRCNYEWDVRQTPCPQCGLHIRMPGRQGAANRLVPIKDSPADNLRSPSNPGTKANSVRPNYPILVTQDKPVQPQVPARFDDFQSPKFPITDKLQPKQALSPASAESYLLSVHPATISGNLPDVQANGQQLLPNTLLHRERYNLQKKLLRQEWPLGIVETIWSASDTRFTKSAVTIYELSVPDDAPGEAQDIAHAATKVFTSIGRHPHILPLRDVFSAYGRSFFVFEAVNGMPISTLMLNSGGKLSEQEAITACIQIVQLLEMCAQQSPPLVHGTIRPEYVIRKFADTQYTLTNFSVALAGGLAQIVTKPENVALIPYNIIEQFRGKMDVRTDLSALLAVVHYVVTGYVASNLSTKIASSDLSPRLSTILLKGLRAPLSQRYQTAAELYQDLLALRNVSDNAFPTLSSTAGEPGRTSFTARSLPLQNEGELKHLINAIQSAEEQPEQVLLVPLPEELPPLKDAHDMRNAILWFAAMLLCFILVLGHGLL